MELGDAALGAVGHDAQERVLSGEAAQHVGRRIEAPVIDHHELAGVGERQQRFAHQAHQLWQVLCFVLGWDEDTHFGARPCSREAHSRLRMRAGRMLS